MTMERICVFLVSLATLLQTMPCAHGWTCPPPGASAREMTVIVTRRYSNFFGTLYRFESNLNNVANGWDVVTGYAEDEISYFKAYSRSIQPEYQGSGVIGISKWLRCGGFEKRIRVCRARQSLDEYSSRVSFDYLTEGSCGSNSERFSFYVADRSRDYEQTTRYRVKLCRNSNPNANSGYTWVGLLGYTSPDCDNTESSFDFHAIRGNKLCERIQNAPSSSSWGDVDTEESGLYQASLTFRCYPGYETSDGHREQTISCQQGDWSEQPQACRKVRCTEPPFVEHGAWTGNNNEYGSYLSLQCDEGYQTSDSYTTRIQCQAEGIWSDTSATCQARSCRHPGTPRNGDVSGDSYSYGAEVSFTCDNGYWMEGRESLSCQANGRWDGNIPDCNRKSCQGILAPQNGFKVGTDFGTGSSVQFACHEGFRLIGEDQVTCYEVVDSNEGVWDYNPPTCQKITCPLPASPENGIVSGDDFSYGASITYRCHPGYIRTGAMVARCGLNGEWDSATPTCTALTCRTVEAPENGEMTGSSFSFGSRVQFNCVEGFTIVGSSTLVCNEDGRWSDNVPRCQAVACPELPNIDNGIRIGAASNEFGIEVNWQCFPGYQLVGDASTGCQANKQWTHPPPRCEVCPLNQYKEGANAEQCQQCPEHSTTLTDASPSIEHCNCLPGYNRLEDYSCLPVSCAPPTPPQNGSLAEGCSTDFGGECTFNCDPGFVLSSGSRTISCGINGWSSSTPICNECPVNTYKENIGSLTCHPCPRNSHTFNRAGTSVESCVCITGYEHPEDSSDCADIDECLADNGGCSDECINTQGSYYCQCSIAGYELEADGRTCVAVRFCTELDDQMINGELDCRYTERENGHICFIKCAVGFFFVSGQNDYVTCGVETNWVWSHQVVNASATVPACTEEFFVDMKIEMTYDYSLDEGNCDNSASYLPQQDAIIRAAVQTATGCAGRCLIPRYGVNFNCTGDGVLKTSVTMYLINYEERPVGDGCDMACRTGNLRRMYADLFTVITEIRQLVSSSSPNLTLSDPDAPALVPASFENGQPIIFCNESGNVLTKYRLCVPCAPGYYLPNPEDEACSPCPEGTYQPGQGKTSCLSCPPDSTTIGTGSSHVTMCSVRISVIGTNPGAITVNKRRRRSAAIDDEELDIDEIFSFL